MTPDETYRDTTSVVKRCVKATIDAISTVAAVPAFLGFHVAALFVGKQHAFVGWSQGMSMLPGLIGVYLRRAFYRLTLSECGDGTCLTFGTVISHPSAQIGRNVYVGAFCMLGDVTLEEDVLLGSHVSIINGGAQHGTDRLDLPVREQRGSFPRVTIGRDSWIGDRAVVMADVGRQCVVAAGAVVTKPTPDYSIVAGVPAKIIRFRRPDAVDSGMYVAALEEEALPKKGASQR